MILIGWVEAGRAASGRRVWVWGLRWGFRFGYRVKKRGNLIFYVGECVVLVSLKSDRWLITNYFRLIGLHFR